MSYDVLLSVMNSTTLIGESVKLQMHRSESCDKCFDLDAEFLKTQNLYNELLKSYSQPENHCISLELSMQLNQEIFQKDKSCDNQNALEILEYFENNDLKAQLQAKDTIIFKLKEHIKSIRENDKEEKTKQCMDEIETTNIQLEHSVAKLISENELLHKEIMHLKKIFKEQFDSIKMTRARSKEHTDSLIAQLNSKSMENVDLKSQIQEKVYVTTTLQNELRNLKGKNVLDNATTIALGMFKLDLELIFHRLKSKDEAPEAIIKCIKKFQVHLIATVRNVRTDDRTEFVNQTLHEFYENVGITHQTSVARTPQQNSVVERLNRTLVGVAYPKPFTNPSPLQQNSIRDDARQEAGFIVSHVFGSLCYLTNDSEDLGKLNAKSRYWYFSDAPRAVEIADSPSSITIDIDALSSCTSSTNQQQQSLIISQGVEEPIPNAYFYDPCHEPLYDISTSQESSSNVQSSHSPLELISRWTKVHPLANMIDNPSRPVSTRKQIETDAMWCYFDIFLTSMEPKTFKQAII
nr:hypothetical protein [Tanacetum cinerariifolium]